MSDTEGLPTNYLRLKRVDLARCLGVKEQTISNYAKDGMRSVDPDAKGAAIRYSLPDCIQWVIEHEAKKLAKQKRPISDDIDELERRRALADTLRAEYKTAEIMGETVTVDEAEREMGKRLEPVRAKLTAIPGVWAPQLTNIRAIPDAVEVLDKLVYRLMEDISNPEQDDDSDDDAVEAEEAVVVEEEIDPDNIGT
jgi:phage terminase Nu1 subunit (DNA packaging protein)